MFGEFYFGQPYFADGPGQTTAPPVTQAVAFTVAANPGAAPYVPARSYVKNGHVPGTAPYYVPFTVQAEPFPAPYVAQRSYLIQGIVPGVAVVTPLAVTIVGTTPAQTPFRSYSLPGITIGTPPAASGTPSGLAGFVKPSETHAGSTSPSMRAGTVSPAMAAALAIELRSEANLTLLTESGASIYTEG